MIPVLYVMFQWLRERLKGQHRTATRSGDAASSAEATAGN
jgi:hypothetical protein